MSSAPKLQHAEPLSQAHPTRCTLGTRARHRSCRMALFCTTGTSLVLLTALLLEQSPRTLHAESPVPALMEMRLLPPPPTPPVVTQPPPSEAAPVVLHSDQGSFQAAVPPLLKEGKPVPPMPEPPKKEAIKEKPKDKIKDKPKPKPDAKPRSAPPAPPKPTAPAADVAVAQDTATSAHNAKAAAQDAQDAQADKAAQSLALHALMQAIEQHKHYPRQARRSNAQGTVALLVRIGQDGRVTACTVQQGSGSPVLDGAARQLAEKIRGVDSGVRGKELQVVVPVRYSLS